MRSVWIDGFLAGVTFVVGLYAGARFLARTSAAIAAMQADAEAELELALARRWSYSTVQIAEA